MSLGFKGQSWQQWLGEFFATPYIRDYTHSAKIFRENSYELSPKQKFLFHVYFDINPDAVADPINQRPIGLLVKEVKLPSYRFDVKEYNQYNRKRLVQTKINYDPVTITLHDDTAGIMNEMWHAYYTYYYADGRKPNPGLGNVARGNLSPLINGGPAVDVGTLATVPLQTVQQRTQYRNINPGEGDWGYIGENFRPEPDPTKVPFFRKITIFGFAQHNFIAYTLINPVITEFAHDTYNYDEGNGVMKNTMSLNYETVVYNQGAIDGTDPGAIAVGFAQEGYYDRENSPITPFGYNGKIWGPTGLLDGAGGFIDTLLSGDPLKAITQAGLGYATYKNVNLDKQFKKEWNEGLQNFYRDASNPQYKRSPFEFPTAGGPSPSQLGQAGQPTPGVIRDTEGVNDLAYAGRFITQDQNQTVEVVIVAGEQFPSGRGDGGARFPT